ncbi:hypothetical protein CRG98_019504 [Punica granatum]|uniref:Uncharacterized protein n=1 Tax=Punica granatum TaxID=22663 RepID=A0A2I0JXA1_PUNGR|nr:hypothetical protein CRG98_019504 [Punica granatum]
MRTPKCNAAWECPPSRGRVMDAREKESPLPVYDPKVEGRIGSRDRRLERWTQCESSPKWSGSTRITLKCKNITRLRSAGLGRVGRRNWAAARIRAGPNKAAAGQRPNWAARLGWADDANWAAGGVLVQPGRPDYKKKKKRKVVRKRGYPSGRVAGCGGLRLPRRVPGDPLEEVFGYRSNSEPSPKNCKIFPDPDRFNPGEAQIDHGEASAVSRTVTGVHSSPYRGVQGREPPSAVSSPSFPAIPTARQLTGLDPFILLRRPSASPFGPTRPVRPNALPSDFSFGRVRSELIRPDSLGDFFYL